MRKLIASLMLGWLLLISASPASAHAQLVSANPRAKAVVYALPSSIRLMFSDDLIDLAEGNQIQVTDPKGKRIDTGQTLLVGNQLTARVNRSTILGRYTITYRVISEDSHPISARYYFTLAKKPKK